MSQEFNVTAQEISDACQTPLPALALEGLALFNQGEYFEAHESLELAWRAERGAVRELYRGILQIAVAYYHILRGNQRGALKMFLRARTWLDPFPDACCGIDLAGFRRDYRRVEAALQQMTPEQLSRFDRGLLKPIDYPGRNKA